MKRLTILLWLAGILLFSGCKSKNAVSTADFTKKVYIPEYASGFEIAGTDGGQSTLIRIFNPWQGAKDVEMSYFVARNGEKAPRDFEGVTIPAGARRIVCMSSSYIAMLDALEQTDRIVGVSEWIIFPIRMLSPIRRRSRIWDRR